MKSIWKITIDDYLEIVKRAKEDGVKPGESIEKYFIEYLKEKEYKPIGNTELTKEEMIKEYNSHGEKILDISIDKEGKSKYKIHKRIDNKN